MLRIGLNWLKLQGSVSALNPHGTQVQLRSCKTSKTELNLLDSPWSILDFPSFHDSKRCLSVGDGHGGTRSGEQWEPPNKSPLFMWTRNSFILGKYQRSFTNHHRLNFYVPARQPELSGPERLPNTVLTAAQRKRRECYFTYCEKDYLQRKVQLPSQKLISKKLESTRIKDAHSTLIWSSERL